MFQTRAELEIAEELNAMTDFKVGDNVSVTPRFNFLSEPGVVTDVTRFSGFIGVRTEGGTRFYVKSKVSPII